MGFMRALFIPRFQGEDGWTKSVSSRVRGKRRGKTVSKFSQTKGMKGLGTHKGLLAASNVDSCQDMRRNSAATPGMDKCLVSRLGGDSCAKRPIINNASMYDLTLYNYMCL